MQWPTLCFQKQQESSKRLKALHIAGERHFSSSPPSSTIPPTSFDAWNSKDWREVEHND